MRNVVPVDVPVAGEAEVGGVDPVRLEHAGRVRTDEELVVVEHDARLVVIVMDAALDRVAGPDEVLAVVVGDEDVLPPVVERVQAAVRVLLGLAEVDEVELVAVAVEGAEQPDGPVRVAEDEPAEVAGEELRPDPHRHEIVFRAEVGQLRLGEVLLEREPRPRAVLALGHVRADVRPALQAGRSCS